MWNNLVVKMSLIFNQDKKSHFNTSSSNERLFSTQGRSKLPFGRWLSKSRCSLYTLDLNTKGWSEEKELDLPPLSFVWIIAFIYLRSCKNKKKIDASYSKTDNQFDK